MRIATYNVEWFNALFDDTGALLADGQWSARWDVTRAQQAEALGIVFTALDADAVMIIEAPDGHAKRSTDAALATFAKTYDLRTNAVATGFINETQQEIALLYDPTRLSVAHDPLGTPTGKKGATGAPRFDGTFRLDLDVDATPDSVQWSKPPLELNCTSASGTLFRLIGVHAKSKAPHGAKTRDEVMRVSIANRRKQLAQCIWLRARVDEHLAAGDPMIVLGDFNDGPGLDTYEALFGRSGVEIVVGEGDQPRLFDPHADTVLKRRFGAMPVTARFFNRESGRYIQTLLDYIMVSPDLVRKAPSWRIWHPFDDPVCYGTPDLRDALLTASDHFPVTLDIDL
ncbi:MAG: endonuclease/exonuclease/phosphatase family protein [Pseudomonadota bacterium]